MIRDNIADKLVYSTVKLTCYNSSVVSNGTAFFMTMNYDDNNITALVTNKHVVTADKEHKCFFEQANLVLTKADDKNNPINNEHVTVHIENLESRCIFHPNKSIDVCLVFINDLITKVQEEGTNLYYRCIGTDFRVPNDILNDLTPIEDIIMIAQELIQLRIEVMDANAADVAAAGVLTPAFKKRLTVDGKVFDYMVKRLMEAAALPDPVGNVLDERLMPSGLLVRKVAVPIGVLAMIYEARPNVTTDAAAVAVKSGNAVILKGGSESLRTNHVLAEAMRRAVCRAGLPEDTIQLVATADRSAVAELLQQDKYIDLIIPRGGKSLIKAIAEGTRIPVLKHYDGICHQYIAADADENMAVDVVVNSKCQNVAVCNALETLLLDSAVSDSLLEKLVTALKEHDVEIRGCERFRARVPGVVPAEESDWDTEYLSSTLSIRMVDGIDEAMKHIAEHGSGHTDGIITSSQTLKDRFIAGVDSASVLVNASTRLSGGGDYGMGAVVGISTDRLHARGPVGPAELCTYKYVAVGDGQLRN